MFLIITLLIAILGGILGMKMKIPAGGLIGSMIAVALYNITTGLAVFPIEFKIITQAATGAYVGARICKKDIVELKYIIKPAIILSICMCTFNILISIFISKVSTIDLPTALFGTAPGGVTDMSIISLDFGADSATVALLQLIRLLSVVSITPHIIKFVVKKFGDDRKEELKNKNSETHTNADKSVCNIIITLIIALIAGLIGRLSKVPAGTMSFSMIACALYNIKTNKGYMPIKVRKCIQFLAGALIGCKIDLHNVIEILDILPIVFIVIISFLVLNLITAYFIHKYSQLDIITSLFSSSAGGMTDLSIIADEMGADTTKVVSIQLTRVISVIGIYPLIISFIIKILN